MRLVGIYRKIELFFLRILDCCDWYYLEVVVILNRFPEWIPTALVVRKEVLFWGDKEARDDFNTRNFFHRFLVNGIFCDGSKCGKLVQKSGGNIRTNFHKPIFQLFSNTPVIITDKETHYRISMYRMEHEGSGDYAQFIWKDDSAKKWTWNTTCLGSFGT